VSDPAEDLVESYFLWCIGKLSAREQAGLRNRARELREHYGCGGAWYEIVEEQMGWPMAREGRTALRRDWPKLFAYWKSRQPSFTARDGARMFKQSNPRVR
jgi:hypothetical protein